MTGVSSGVSSVGAGVSQGRNAGSVKPTQLKDQGRSEAGVRAAALQLIQSAIAVPVATSGHDLNVLA